MSRLQRGFTLIELMIVVAIIGILAAIGAQLYIDYVRRTHVSEGVNLASGAKVSVTEYFTSKGSMPTSNTEAGLATTITGNAVSGIAVEAGGVVRITYNEKIGTTGQDLTFVPSTTNNGSITWSCTGGSVLPAMRPSACRN